MRLVLFFALLCILGNFAFSQETLEMAYLDAKKCDDLTCVRKQIDEINSEIIALLVKRTAYVRRAGDLKLGAKIAHDQKRIDDQVQTIARKSEALGLPKEISTEAFKAIIKNSTEFEQKYIDKVTQ